MIQEIRRVALGMDELRAAIEGYRRAAPDFLPAGTLSRCEATADGVVVVCVEIKRDGFTRPAEFTLRGIDLLRPIVCFCLQNGVPLPGDGRASALIEANTVTIRITRDMDVAVPAWIVADRLDRIKSVTGLSPADINLEEPAMRSGT